ncbi:LON peptidase substrate-binding domain-containing protein [Glaciihabitans arcticus]|nr:LON peptidase substrate-binding domain-containing protein [Glaciihabitans arcticus]
MDRDLPMFPLGSVLFPHMPVQLRVFEQRYMVMLAEILDVEPSEFGVVLIERGQEVGGGEQRFSAGTIARIAELEGAEGFVALVAEGANRFVVEEWLDDAPYPRARVRELPDLVWDEELEPLRERAEKLVRRALAVASEFADQQWAADVSLSGDPLESSWQLAAISPLGPLDQVALLRVESLKELLDLVIELTEGVDATFGSLLEAGDEDVEEI